MEVLKQSKVQKFPSILRLASAASVSVGFSAHLKHFRLLAARKLSQGDKKCEEEGGEGKRRKRFLANPRILKHPFRPLNGISDWRGVVFCQ